MTVRRGHLAGRRPASGRATWAQPDPSDSIGQDAVHAVLSPRLAGSMQGSNTVRPVNVPERNSRFRSLDRERLLLRDRRWSHRRGRHARTLHLPVPAIAPASTHRVRTPSRSSSRPHCIIRCNHPLIGAPLGAGSRRRSNGGLTTPSIHRDLRQGAAGHRPRDGRRRVVRQGRHGHHGPPKSSVGKAPALAILDLPFLFNLARLRTRRRGNEARETRNDQRDRRGARRRGGHAFQAHVASSRRSTHVYVPRAGCRAEPRHSVKGDASTTPGQARPSSASACGGRPDHPRTTDAHGGIRSGKVDSGLDDASRKPDARTVNGSAYTVTLTSQPQSSSPRRRRQGRHRRVAGALRERPQADGQTAY